MARWHDVETAQPAWADRVRSTFAVRKHATIATLRRDGSPRISGTEVVFGGGEVRLGMMPGSRKAADLARDPRLALHSPTVDTPEGDPGSWLGDGKIGGRAVEVPGPSGGTEGVYFLVDVDEVVLTYVETPPDRLVVESWHPGRGLERTERC